MRIAKTVTGRILFFVVLVFAICAFWQTTSMIADNQVQRPERIKGTGTVTVNLSNCSIYEYCPSTHYSWGESTHAGRYTNEASGSFRIIDFSAFSDGVFTAANGDQIYWEENGTAEVILTGGTGRFEGVSGGFAFTEIEILETSGYPILTVRFTFRGEGTITY